LQLTLPSTPQPRKSTPPFVASPWLQPLQQQ
jgi:hypothetical protein